MKELFTDLARWGNRPAIIASDTTLSYEELEARVAELATRVGSTRQLVLIEATNELEPLLWYLACVRGHHPVMLLPSGRTDIESILDAYHPSVVLSKIDGTWTARRHGPPPATHPDLAVLLSTSGSTGAAKFVRLSRENLAANAASIVSYLGIMEDDRAVTTLPFHYSYGLSVVNSHLMAGATLLLTDDSVVEPTFWKFFSEERATSLAAVPYTFELLDRVGFEQMDLPCLRYVTAAGGRVPPATVARYAAAARTAGWQLFVMYGQTEATARMAYVPPECVERFPESIGHAIPGGAFELRDEHGRTITERGRSGELVYRGPNVMMGYARSQSDLAEGASLDELATGDLAQRDAQGFYSIVGRKSRFLKIFGLRIALDELEARLRDQGYQAVVTGTDEFVAVGTLDEGACASIRELVTGICKLPPHVVGVTEYDDDFPLLATGKVDYARVRDDGAASIERAARSPRPHHAGCGRSSLSIRNAYMDVLRVTEVKPEDTFVGLGGDSLSYIQVEMVIESVLGYAPRDWHRMPISQLESLDRREARMMRVVEMPVVLRAVGMTLIVAGHLGLFYFPGSSTTLFAIAGLNFARFQLPAIISRDSPRPALHGLVRIVVPTALYTFAITLALGYSLSLPITLFYSNHVGIDLNDGMSYWFIELLAQFMLIMALLFSWTRMRRAVAVDARAFGFTLLAVSLAMRALGPLVWDTDHLLNRVPHAALWLFVVGWCVYCMRSTLDRLALTAVAVVVPPLAFDALTPRLMGVIGLTLLVWIDRVPVPRGLDRVVSTLAAASLYIYLTHFQFRSVLEDLGITNEFASVVVALAGGVVVARAADRATSLVVSTMRRGRSSTTQGSGSSPDEADPLEPDPVADVNRR